jgi:hypothetical protein
MARARRTLDRKALREQNEAADRKKDDDKDEADEEEEEEEPEEAASADDEGDEEKPKPKKKKAAVKKPAKPKAPAKPRSRAAKVVRMKVVWAVYSNSHALVEEFPYPQKADAEALLAKLTADKKSGGPFFLQPLKKPLDKE